MSQQPSNDRSDPLPGSNGRSATLEIDRLIREHHGAVYRYAYRLTGRQADAEDLSQQTFLIAQQKLDQLRDPDKAGSWLLTIVRNCYLRQRRKSAPQPAGALELEVDHIPDGGAPPAGAEAQWIDRQWLQEALDRLPDEFKVVLVMFYFEDLSYKEIAQRLDVPAGTVMSRLSRAKGRLRALLQESEERASSSPPKSPPSHLIV